MTKDLCVVAVDAMGGDHAPKALVEGAKLAAKESNGSLKIILVGKEKEICSCAPDLDDFKEIISVVHASQVIEMCDSPLTGLKEKKNSSINVATNLIKNKQADAVFSGGNTGAFMASSLFAAGKVPGVSRPTIGTFYPKVSGDGFLVDVGANTDCKPQHLLQFGIMGATFVKLLKGINDPKIGLLSVGEEPSKGDALTIEAHKLFLENDLNFIGNVEGRDIFNEKADVIVCDGFIGNVILKMMETLGGLFESVIDKGFNSLIKDGINADLMKGPFDKFKESFNYENYGGVPLLGLNGISVIGHGHSSPEAVKAGIFIAEKMYNKKLYAHIKTNIDIIKGV